MRLSSVHSETGHDYFNKQWETEDIDQDITMYNSATDNMVRENETMPLVDIHLKDTQFLAASRLASWDYDVTDSDSVSSHGTVDEDEEIIDRQWFTYPIALDWADDVCIKLNDLIQRGVISRDRIMYKYLRDTVNCFIDPNHQHDEEVVEFFNTIEHLGGESTVNFLRGPMLHGTKKGGIKKPDEANPNLSGPSKPTRQKMKGGYTTASGVLKDMHLGFLKFVSGEMYQIAPVLDRPNIKVFVAAMQNDGTALQPGILFDEGLKCNVGLKTKVDLQFAKDNPSPDATFLKADVITEANVSIITTLCGIISMPVAVEYVRKAGKTGEDMLSMFTKQIESLQCCQACVEKTCAHELISQCN